MERQSASHRGTERLGRGGERNGKFRTRKDRERDNAKKRKKKRKKNVGSRTEQEGPRRALNKRCVGRLARGVGQWSGKMTKESDFGFGHRKCDWFAHAVLLQRTHAAEMQYTPPFKAVRTGCIPQRGSWTVEAAATTNRKKKKTKTDSRRGKRGNGWATQGPRGNMGWGRCSTGAADGTRAVFSGSLGQRPTAGCSFCSVSCPTTAGASWTSPK